MKAPQKAVRSSPSRRSRLIPLPFRGRDRLVWLGIVLVALVGNWAWPSGSGDERAVRAAAVTLSRAWKRKDFGRVWELLSTDLQAQYAQNLAFWLDPTRSPEEQWKMQVRRYGIGRAEAERMSPRAWFVAHLSHMSFELEPEYDRSVRMLGSLRTGRIQMAGDRALVQARSRDAAGMEEEALAVFHREEGGWRLADAVSGSTDLLSLERKLRAFLPEGPVPPEDVTTILRVGPEGATKEDLARIRRLGARLAGKKGRLLLDVSPEASFQTLVTVYDTLLAGGLKGVLFGGPGEGSFRPGVRVNGVPIADALAGPLPPRPADDPALHRILEDRLPR